MPKSKSKLFIRYIKPVSAICNMVVDGDTLIIDIARVKKRVGFIGVDSSETKRPQKPVQYFGKEASMFTANMLEGKKIRLEFDQTRGININGC